MFRAFSRPSSGAQWLQWRPLVLPSYRGDSRAVFVVGPAGPTTNTARCSMVGETAATSCLMFCFKSTVVLGFFSYTLLLRYPQRKKYCDQGHSFRWILKCRRNILWVKTESLCLKIVSTAKARCSTYQRSMATEMLWVSLEERSGTNSPRQRFHSQLCCQIVRYFFRTLYLTL